MSGNRKSSRISPITNPETPVSERATEENPGLRSGGDGDGNSGLMQISDYYAEILGQIDDAVIILDNQERVVYLNPAAERQYEVSARNFLGRPIRELHDYEWFDPEDEKNAYAALRETGRWRGENIHIKGSGERIFVESAVSVLRGAADRQPTGMLAIIRDVTARKRREMNDAFLSGIGKKFNHLSSPDEIMSFVGEKLSEHLRVSRVFFVEIDEAQNQSIVLKDWSRDDLPSTAGVYRLEEYAGESFLRELKKGKTVAINDVRTDPMTSAAAEKFAALDLGSSLNAPFIGRGELRFLLAVQHRAPYRWREDEIALLGDLSGRVWSLLENARADEELRASEEKYRTLFNSIDEGFCLIEMIFDDAGKPFDYVFLQVNPAFYELTGLPANAVGRTARAMLPALEEFWFETYGQVALSGEAVSFENKADSMNRWFEVSAVRVGGEQSRRVALVFNDITDRKRAEEILQKSESQNRAILESVSDGFVALDEHWKFIYINAAARKIMHIEAGNLIGKEIWEVYPGLAESRFGQIYRRVAEEKVSLSLTDYYPDHERWYEVNVFPAAKGITIYFRDATRLKETEIRLREANSRLEASLSGADLGVWTFNPATGEFWADERARLMHGYPPDEPLTFEKAGERVHPDDRERAQTAFAAAVENNSKLQMENRIILPDRTVRWIASYCEFITGSEPVNSGGGIFYGISQDITARKNQEAALEAAQQTFRHLVEHSPFGVYIVDSDFRLVQVSAGAQKLFQNVRPLIGRDFAEVLRIVWAEPFAGEAVALFRRTLETGEPYHSPGTTEKRGDTGEIEAYDWKIERISLPDGRYGVVCHFYDLSERLRYEAELRESEKRLRLATGAARMYSWEIDLETQETSFGGNFAQVVGLAAPIAKMATAETYEKLIHPDDREKVKNFLEAAIAGESAPSLELRLVNPLNGAVVWIETTCYLIRREEDGAPLRVVGVSQNVTERKRGEERLRETNAVLNAINLNTPTLIYVKDRECRILSANPATCQVIGKPLSEIVGKNHLEYMDGQRGVEEILANDRRIVASGRTETFEEVVEDPDGGKRIFLSTKTPYRGDNGEIIGLIGVSVDITERKGTEEKLSARERELQQLADAMPQVVWIADAEGTVYYYNRRVENFSGIEQTAAGTWSWQPVVHPDDLASTAEAWETAVRQKSPYVKEHRIMMREGGYRWHLSRAVPALDEHGKITKWHGTATDIHEIKESEVERQKLLEEADAASRAKDQFLAVLSHELRTPLNTMYGWTQMLLTSELDAPSARKAIETIARSVRLQNALIEDLLDVSRIVSGKMRLEPERVSLVSLLQSAIDAARPAAEKQQVALAAELDPQADEMFGDRHRLQQIISNLLTNAVKFTPAGGAVRVELRRSGKFARLSVSDTGIGIAPDLLPLVFQRFQQAESSSKRKYGGLGLGLTIVKHLVELHGGTISASSEGEGKGSVFTVEFPLEEEKIASIDLTHDRANHPPQPAKMLSRARILVVDDDPDSLDLICFALRERGAEVHCRASARDAFNELELNDFDLLVSDLGMAEIDGYDLIRMWRAREEKTGAARSLPAIALTGYVSADDRERVLAAGFQMHLPKPVDLDELAAAAERLIKM